MYICCVSCVQCTPIVWCIDNRAYANSYWLLVCFIFQNWTETYVRWSPNGNYLATFHKRGIALWGAEKFKQIMRFQHEGVQLIDFSPCEKYDAQFYI